MLTHTMWTKISVIVLLAGNARPDSYNNEWSAHVPGGEEAARKVGEDTGCDFAHAIIPGKLKTKVRLDHLNL